MNEGDPGSPPRNRRMLLLSLSGLSVAVLVGLGWFFLVAGSEGREVAPDEARERLQTTSTFPSDPGVLRPPQGLYMYRGSGSDVLDTPPRNQAQGPEMPATVIHGSDGCWSMRIDYHSNHWQQWDYCSTDGELDEVGGESHVRWDFGVFLSETDSVFLCDQGLLIEPDQVPGDEWEFSCRTRGESETDVVLLAGTTRYVGREQLDIGGQSVEADRYLRELTISGSQEGSERTDAWFDAATGMPLRNEREVVVRVASAVGQTTSTETGEFQLESLEPQG